MDLIENPERLRELYGAPSERSLKKQLTKFDKHCRAFIARSPFLVIASSDPSGRCDASPKGDAPGFVHVLDDETLRVNGRARVTTDPAVLEPLAVNGKVPRSGILVAAEEIYFHCGKALIRSDLWNPKKHLRRSEFPSLGRILADQIGGISVEEAERQTVESYKTRLY